MYTSARIKHLYHHEGVAPSWKNTSQQEHYDVVTILKEQAWDLLYSHHPA